MTWKHHGYDPFLRRTLAWGPNRGREGSLSSGEIKMGDSYQSTWNEGDINLGDTIFGDEIYGDNISNEFLGPTFNDTLNQTYETTNLDFDFTQITKLINIIDARGPRDLLFFKSGAVAVGSDVSTTWIAKQNYTILGVYVKAKTAPVGSALLINIYINGTPIWTAGNEGGLAAGSSFGAYTNINNYAVIMEDVLTLDVVQVGSSTAGSDLSVQLLLMPLARPMITHREEWATSSSASPSPSRSISLSPSRSPSASPSRSPSASPSPSSSASRSPSLSPSSSASPSPSASVSPSSSPSASPSA